MITEHRSITTPAGNPTYWVHVTGSGDADLRRSAYVAAAHARKIAKRMPAGTRAFRITSGWTLGANGPGTFEARVLYAFHSA